MLKFTDFYDIADYANAMWKGDFTLIEIAENAYNLYEDFKWSKENGEVANSISTLLKNLDENISNDEQHEDVQYWASEIREELGLNFPTIARAKDGMARLMESLPKGTKITIELQ